MKMGLGLRIGVVLFCWVFSCTRWMRAVLSFFFFFLFELGFLFFCSFVCCSFRWGFLVIFTSADEMRWVKDHECPWMDGWNGMNGWKFFFLSLSFVMVLDPSHLISRSKNN